MSAGHTEQGVPVEGMDVLPAEAMTPAGHNAATLPISWNPQVWDLKEILEPERNQSVSQGPFHKDLK